MKEILPHIPPVFKDKKKINTPDINTKLLLPRDLPPVQSREALQEHYIDTRTQIRCLHFVTNKIFTIKFIKKND